MSESMFDLPTGRISQSRFERLQRRVRNHFAKWQDRIRWQGIILALLPEEEQAELTAWASSCSYTEKDRAMLILVVFFNAALPREKLRHGKACTELQLLFNRIQDEKTARGIFLRKNEQRAA